MRRYLILLLTQAIWVAASGPLAAGVYIESTDAGSLPQSAEDAVVPGPVEALRGSIAHAFDADLFRIASTTRKASRPP